MKLTVAASGAADPDIVWDRYVHPARWREWSPQIRSVDYPDQTIGAGGRGTVHGPCGVGVAFEILAVDDEQALLGLASHGRRHHVGAGP